MATLGRRCVTHHCVHIWLIELLVLALQFKEKLRSGFAVIALAMLALGSHPPRLPGRN
jgi:hypothetical protein